MEALVDTDILINFLRGTQELTIPSIHISSITAFELLYGAHRSNKKKNLESTQQLINRVHVKTFTQQTADIAARMHATQVEQGKTIDIRDLFIAASAKEHRLPIHTNNTKHFATIKDVHLWQDS